MRALGLPGIVVPAVAYPIMQVGASSVPSEITQSVVLRVVIKVTPFHALRAWADESEQNEPMDQEGLDVSISGETYLEVPPREGDGR